jgi:hypothetical protein
MIEAAKANIIGPAVAAKNPLRALGEVVLVLIQAIKQVIVALFRRQQRAQFFRPRAGTFAEIFVLQPVAQRLL